MPITPLPSRELVQRLLRYDAETGDLVWLPRSADLIPDNNKRSIWNNKHAGKVAGYARPAQSPRYGAYIIVGIYGTLYKAHRLVWLHVHGEPVPDMIDHRDKDQLNNRIDNLRAATMALNRANSRVRKDNALGIKGVHKTKHGRFMALAGGNYLGTYATVEQAVAAYNEEASRRYGEFARHDQKYTAATVSPLDGSAT